MTQPLTLEEVERLLGLLISGFLSSKPKAGGALVWSDAKNALPEIRTISKDYAHIMRENYLFRDALEFYANMHPVGTKKWNVGRPAREALSHNHPGEEK